MTLDTNKGDKFLKISLIVTLVLLALILIFAGVTYAFWQKDQTLANTNEIKSGCFSFSLNDQNNINLSNTYPMSENDAMKKTPYTFTITNTCSIDMAYNITLNTTGNSDLDQYLNFKLIDENDNVIGPKIISTLPTYEEYNNYTYSDDDGDYKIINSYILTSGLLGAATMDSTNTEIVAAGESKTYDLYIWMDANVEDVNTMGKSFEAKVLVTSKIVNQDNFSNENIITAYAYNQDSTASNYCVSGDEETCVKTDCYKEMTAGSCNSGDIIEYKVNDSDTVRFHVMYDNGDTLTMQSQKNTVYNVPWINAEDYATTNTDGTSCDYNSCHDEGPITILNSLENATSGWSNVNTINYTMGTTIFKTNAYTGCNSYNTCNTNTYSLPKRNTKARMLTLQEATELGCTSSSKICPIWIYNYLIKSVNFNGTINDMTTENGATTNSGYWIMNADSSNVIYSWNIFYDGAIFSYHTYDTSFGARAVVEINK